MSISNARRLATCVALFVSFTQAASAGEILIADAKSQPESLTVAPGGVLIVGSASSPFVYRVRSGSSTAEKFIGASAEGPGTFFFGMLVYCPINMLHKYRVLDKLRYVDGATTSCSGIDGRGAVAIGWFFRFP